MAACLDLLNAGHPAVVEAHEARMRAAQKHASATAERDGSAQYTACLRHLSAAVTAALDYAGPTLDTARGQLAALAVEAAEGLDAAWAALLGLSLEALEFDGRRGAFLSAQLRGACVWGPAEKGEEGGRTTPSVLLPVFLPRQTRRASSVSTSSSLARTPCRRSGGSWRRRSRSCAPPP